MIIEKRGLSSVIATALLILLTIIAVTMIAAFVVPFVRNSLEETSCFEFRDYFKFDESLGYNCYQDNANDRWYLTTIRAKTDESIAGKVDGFALRFVKQDAVERIDVLNGRPASVLGYNYSSSNYYEKAEIYAIIENDKICDMSDSIKLTKCG